AEEPPPRAEMMQRRVCAHRIRERRELRATLEAIDRLQHLLERHLREILELRDRPDEAPHLTMHDGHDLLPAHLGAPLHDHAGARYHAGHARPAPMSAVSTCVSSHSASVAMPAAYKYGRTRTAIGNWTIASMRPVGPTKDPAASPAWRTPPAAMPSSIQKP